MANAFTPLNDFIIYSAIPIYGIANFYAGIQFSRKVDDTKKFEYLLDANDKNTSIEQEVDTTIQSTEKNKYRISLG